MYARMPVSSSFLIAGWTKVGEGAQAHSSDEAKNVSGTGHAVLHLCEAVGSESISLFLFNLL